MQAAHTYGNQALGIVFCGLLSACSGEPARPLASSAAPATTLPTSAQAGSAAVPMIESCSSLVRAERVPPKVVLVLDGSCSMSTNYPTNGGRQANQCTNNARGRWTALRNALIDPTRGIVPKLQKSVAFGLVVYGSEPMCPIPATPVQPAVDNLDKIRTALPMVQPGLNTPTGPALDWVFENMIDEAAPDAPVPPQIVILATDGAPNTCEDANATRYQPSIDAVLKGRMKGARTYVISLAESTGMFHDHLIQLANLADPAAQGMAKLYEPTSPDQLANDLMSLASAAVGCDVKLNGAISVAEACNGSVTLDGTALPCNDPNGWVAVDDRTLRLQGTACNQVKQKLDAKIQADFACGAFRPD